jgi:uncharacterized membrane protein (DUF2068 family)
VIYRRLRALSRAKGLPFSAPVTAVPNEHRALEGTAMPGKIQGSGAAAALESARIPGRQEPAAPEASLRRSRRRLATGVKLIVTYKLVKSLLELALAFAIPVLIVAGAAEHVHALALAFRHHIVSAWNTRLANLLLMLTTRRHLELTAVVLAFDGALTFVEGWSLWRGHAWGAWLVVVATGSLLPFEIRELVRGVRIGPLAVVMVNALVVIYLVSRACFERLPRGG